MLFSIFEAVAEFQLKAAIDDIWAHPLAFWQKSELVNWMDLICYSVCLFLLHDNYKHISKDPMCNVSKGEMKWNKIKACMFLVW